MHADANGPARPLAGRVIAVPETRELEPFARLLEEAGATVLRCPMVAILDAPDPAPALRWIGRLIAGDFHDLILLTGEGLRRLNALAVRNGIQPQFREALAKVRCITRGPKPARALTELGLRPGLSSKVHTTAGVIEALSSEDLNGRVVGIQLYGEDPNEALMTFLRGKGARPETVAPYVYAPASDSEKVVSLIRELAAGRVDAIAFTSSVQARRLREVAHERGMDAELDDGFRKSRVAAIGPVAEQELLDQGVRVDISPKGSNFIKPLVAELIHVFSGLK